MNYFTLYNMYRLAPHWVAFSQVLSSLDDERDWRPYMMSQILGAILDAYE